MKKELKQKILIFKYYFDKGFGLLNNIKYIVGLFALYEVTLFRNLNITIGIILIYGIACYFLGRYYYNHGWNEIEIEIQNRINPFVIEMREKFK